MTTRKKVYAVSMGSYSDYRIVAIFSNQEKAQAYIDASRESVYYDHPNEDIEEYDLDTPITRLYHIDVRMSKDGSVDKEELDIHFGAHESGFGSVWVWKDGPSILSWTVTTKDPKRAVKVVNEKRIQIIALGLWPAEDADQETLRILNKQIKEQVR